MLTVGTSEGLNKLSINYFKEWRWWCGASQVEEHKKEKQSHNKCFDIACVYQEFRNNLHQLYCLRIFWYAGNEEAYQAPGAYQVGTRFFRVPGLRLSSILLGGPRIFISIFNIDQFCVPENAI